MRSNRGGAGLRLLVSGIALALLAGCLSEAEPQETPTPQTQAATVDVDSVQAREIKAAARIAACPKPGKIGSALPEVTLPCLGGGREVSLSTLDGPLVINFFQTTCEPCRDEMPILAEFASANPNIAVLGIDYLDRYPEAALQLAQDTGVRYPLVADPDGLIDETALAPRGLPMTVFVSADGTVRTPHFGEFTSLEQLQEWVDQELAS